MQHTAYTAAYSIQHTADAICLPNHRRESSKNLQELPKTSKDDVSSHRPTRSYRRRNRRADLRTLDPKRGGGGRSPHGVFNSLTGWPVTPTSC